MSYALDATTSINLSECYFYLEHLVYEEKVDISTPQYNPHERLSFFYWALQEQHNKKHHGIVTMLYHNIIKKKQEFFLDNDPCIEEVKDLLHEIFTLFHYMGMHSYLDQ